MKKKTRHEILRCFPVNLTERFLLTMRGLNIIIVMTIIIIIDKILLNISSLMNSLKQILYELIQFFFINSLQAITIQEKIVINEPITSK